MTALSPALRAFEAEVENRRLAALARLDALPVAALIWGPAPTAGTPLADTRILLRDQLMARGHLARFSEDLIDPKSQHSIFLQQVAQAEAHDLVFSLPGSPGSIAEIHDFARIPGLSRKILAFLDESWNSGYANQSLIQLQSIATCSITLYSSTALPGCILTPAFDLVRRLQEVLYVNGRRF